MRDVKTRVFAASRPDDPGIRQGWTDVQTEQLTERPSAPGVTARLTLIRVGTRGGVTAVTALLTDQQRRELIMNLGGYADLPEVYLVEREDEEDKED